MCTLCVPFPHNRSYSQISADFEPPYLDQPNWTNKHVIDSVFQAEFIDTIFRPLHHQHHSVDGQVDLGLGGAHHVWW